MDELEKKVPETAEQAEKELQGGIQQDFDSSSNENVFNNQNAGSGPYGGFGTQNETYGQGQYQDPYGQQPYGAQGMYQPPYQQPQTPPAQGLAIASLILGIVSIPLGLFFSIGGLICAIIGLVLAAMAKKRGNLSGIRTGGLICSIIGLILSIFICIITIIILVMAFSLVGNIVDSGINLFGNGGLNNIINNLGGNIGGYGRYNINDLDDLNNLLNNLNNINIR